MKANSSVDFSFVTSNDIKFQAAKFFLDAHGITFDRQLIEFIEIQADEGGVIARNKAEQAYAALQRPIVVTDDSWLVPGLNGFPGYV
jgi:inosine/xanthosine triphosphate pyrophosphatase family protein